MLRKRAIALAGRLHGLLRPPHCVRVVQGDSLSGGGSLPGTRLTSWLIEVSGGSEEGLFSQLLGHDPPVVARLKGKALLIDLRTVFPHEEDSIVCAFSRDREQTL